MPIPPPPLPWGALHSPPWLKRQPLDNPGRICRGRHWAGGRGGCPVGPVHAKHSPTAMAEGQYLEPEGQPLARISAPFRHRHGERAPGVAAPILISSHGVCDVRWRRDGGWSPPALFNAAPAWTTRSTVTGTCGSMPASDFRVSVPWTQPDARFLNPLYTAGSRLGLIFGRGWAVARSPPLSNSCTREKFEKGSITLESWLRGGAIPGRMCVISALCRRPPGPQAAHI